MIYVLDTSVVLLSLLNERFDTFFGATYRQAGNDLVISAVSEGELWSLAFQRQWGSSRQQKLASSLSQFIVYPVKVQSVVQGYARIDAFSQGKLADKPLPPGLSARNMGKNDLWIAATAYVLGAELLTFDQDFVHLEGTFCGLTRFNVEAYR
ncbi:MAG: type II toxin-antitoxin system VapC family toxin [Bacteroidetes bacterium]|nr:MAG: type II toxin-antitoxin system VapC family toxin [Bacteroidota bacterium]